MIKLKRAYEPASKDDGLRVLVERLWPRGVSKHKAQIDIWLKSLTPSTELRQWFGHDPARWPRSRGWRSGSATSTRPTSGTCRDGFPG